MATSKQTVTQVKDILRKLERNIDAARERRLGAPGVPAARPATPSGPFRAPGAPSPGGI